MCLWAGLVEEELQPQVAEGCGAVGRSWTAALPPEMKVSASALHYFGYSAENNTLYSLP